MEWSALLAASCQNHAATGGELDGNTSSLQTVTTCTVASMTGFLLVPAAYFLPLGG